MKVLFVDADSVSGFPNLALMKIGAWLKETRNDVNIELIHGLPNTAPLYPYDEVYISNIFFQNKEKVADYVNQFPAGSIIEVGGSGWDLTKNLPEYIEHIMPDYSLYDLDYSMGFTSRGCIRKCEFCIVPKKEGKIKDNAPITEFLNANHDRVILLDNNFQASPKWRDNLTYLIDHKIKVNFNQGLDARLVTENFASMLAASRCYDWKFKTKGAHLAFDNPSWEKPLLRALSLFENAGMAPNRFLVYVLVGFNTTYEQDLERVNTIIEAGAVPYIMRYNQTKDPYLKHLARYINRKYYQFVKREDYKDGVLKL